VYYLFIFFNTTDTFLRWWLPPFVSTLQLFRMFDTIDIFEEIEDF